MTTPGGKGDRERKRIAQALKGRGKKLTFTAYSSEEVKQCLVALFGDKCAYCESKYTAVSPMDVEHWRPKGAIITADGKKLKRGYYWLGAEWSNLLPSCIDCNRERKQVTLPDGSVKPSGKAEHFPLADESKRATRPAQVAGEEPLLLDPCADQPDQHLEFYVAEGRKPLVRARTASPRGEASIEVYGLNRGGLVDARQEQMAQIELALSNLRKFVTALEGSSGAVAVVLQTGVTENLAALKTYRTPASRYSVLARAIIDPELKALGVPL